MTGSSPPPSGARPGASELRPGQAIPSLTRSTGFDNWNRYAAVNDEFVPIHMDDEAGRAAGFPSAFGMGNLQWSYLHSVLRQWIGEGGRIVSISCQFRAPNLKGRTVTAGGRITAIRRSGAEVLVDLDVWTVDDSGQTLAPGTAVVAFTDAPDGSGEASEGPDS